MKKGRNYGILLQANYIDDILGICCRSYVFRDTVDSLSNSTKILFEFHREIRLVGKVLCIYK